MSTDPTLMELQQQPHEHAALLDAECFPILAGMSPVHLQILNKTARVMYISAGINVIQEGDAANSLYFIRSGKLAISKRVRDQPKQITYMGEGSILGEFGVLHGKPRYTSVHTEEFCQAIRVDGASILQVLEVDGEFNIRLSQLLRERLLDSFFFTHPVFQQLSAEQRLKLASLLHIQSYALGESICAQGDKHQGMHFILSGKAEISYVSESGHNVLLEIRRANDLIGEMGSHDQAKAPYSTTATSDLDLLLIDNEAMHAIGQIHAPTLLALKEDMRKRVAQTMTRIEENLGN